MLINATQDAAANIDSSGRWKGRRHAKAERAALHEYASAPWYSAWGLGSRLKLHAESAIMMTGCSGTWAACPSGLGMMIMSCSCVKSMSAAMSTITSNMLARLILTCHIMQAYCMLACLSVHCMHVTCSFAKLSIQGNATLLHVCAHQ